MRPKWFLSLLVAAAVAVAGCADEENGHDDCPEGHEDEHCPPATDTGTGTDGPDQNATPNEPPVLVLTVTDAAGNETPVTTPGGSLTFSAMGSSDPDGEITGIAVTIQDRDGTRTQSLFADGGFQDATFIFGQAGRVAVTVSLVDDRAAFTTETSAVYVNHPQAAGPYQMKVTAPSGSAADCKGAAAAAGGDSNETAIADAQYYKAFTFETRAGATAVEASVVEGDAEIAICTPDGVPLSDAGTGSVTTNVAHTYNTSQAYYVATVSQGPVQDVSVDIVVHYEPQAAASPE